MRFSFLVMSVSLVVASQLSLAYGGNEVVSAGTQEGEPGPTRLGQCVLSVQMVYKRMTPADSGEMPLIPIDEALKDPTCPRVTEEIRAAYKRKIRVAQEFGIDSRGRTYNTIGGTTFRSDGTTFQQIGPNIGLGSDGSTQTHFGNSTFNSDGSSVTRFGRRK